MEQQDKNRGLRKRIGHLRIFFIILLAIILFKAWHMQIMQGKYYRKLAENNRVRSVVVPPLRGIIYDRNREVMAKNVASFDLGLVRADIEDLEMTLRIISPITGLSPEEMKDIIIENKNPDPFSPLIIKYDISMRDVALIESRKWLLPGVQVVVEGRREYPHMESAAHLLGYVGEISKSQLKDPEYAAEIPGRIIGQYGIEKVYDNLLRGSLGRKYIEVDAAGRERRELDTIEPVSGDNIILSVDMRLQRMAEDALGERRGAVVVMKSDTGEILALVSSPAFDPNLLSKRLTHKVWQQIVNDPEFPMNNRATQGTYPPGSVFKVVMSAGGLEEGLIDDKARISCSGGMRFGNRVFRDWKPEGHGSVDLKKAIVESCDVYFYQLGNRMGVDTIEKYASLFGLGTITGIDLPSEKKGLVPSTQWKLAAKKERWYPGETLSVAIGQGYMSVTPLQQAVMLNTVANSGVVVRPRILKGIMPEQSVSQAVSKDGSQTGAYSLAGTEFNSVPNAGSDIPTNRVYEFPPVEIRNTGINEHTLMLIKEALKGVVNNAGGTGGAARSNLVEIAGKTGTAQAVGRKSKAGPGSFNDHAWFAAFAPADKPEITVAVLVEHGGHGGTAAAPVAKKIIEEYIKNAE
ncbi:MAG: penicillin-binding protein 2 [Nitrospirae bacterium]|nr:penicillin-binding protein 2 [Nitrospirota bacterium]